MATGDVVTQERWARRSLLTYFAFLLPLTVLGYWLWIVRGQHLALIVVPAISAVATRVVRREGFADISFRLPPGMVRAFAPAFILPLAVCFAAYGLAWGTGLVGFAPARLPRPFPTLSDPYLHFAWTVLLSMTVVTAFFLPLAAGEEVGWRGHMLPRMVAARVPAPILVSAVIWALWHVPLIVTASYAPGGGQPLPASALFVVVASVYGVFLARLRLSTGSVWPPVVAHAAWNALTQACFNPAVRPRLWPWLGETGIITMLCLAVAVAVYLGSMRPRGTSPTSLEIP